MAPTWRAALAIAAVLLATASAVQVSVPVQGDEVCAAPG
jgi:hypothetical protein